ncbi:diacylglycerol/lipid kinase family protein [Bombella dulcis]|uniref:diacylglycerol/lipid kinase family protein n=1 Tax=Bombella dulcis TaxID=2967339 RepID=UPI00389905BD
MQQLSSALKKRVGRLAYLLTALRLPVAHRFPTFETCVDGRTCQARLTIISKGRLYGGPFRLFPHNHHEEPFFSILMLHRLNPLALLRQLLAFASHKPCPDPAVSYIKGQTITCSGNRPVPVQSDGDFRGTTPCRIASAPTPLQIICPPRNPPPFEGRNFFRRYSLNIGKRRY